MVFFRKPLLRNEQAFVDHSVPMLGYIGSKDAYLAIFDLAGCAAILPSHPPPTLKSFIVVMQIMRRIFSIYIFK